MNNMLSENIRFLRTNAGINQITFADRMGVTKQCVSNWENDNVQPSIEMLVKIADYFNVTTDYLLGRDEKRLIDVSHLTDEQTAHISLLINDLSR